MIARLWGFMRNLRAGGARRVESSQVEPAFKSAEQASKQATGPIINRFRRGKTESEEGRKEEKSLAWLPPSLSCCRRLPFFPVPPLSLSREILSSLCMLSSKFGCQWSVDIFSSSPLPPSLFAYFFLVLGRYIFPPSLRI